jgi:stearoyl-CoA desaturase (delta-9 desaturase)
MHSSTLLKQILSSAIRHYRKQTLNWDMIIYITSVHIAAIYGIFCIFHCSIQTLLLAFILWPVSGLGITAGAHRLWAHRSYSASTPYRILLMLFQSIANQGSIFHWTRDHRVHHKYAETDADPHNIYRGFFFAHVGWLLTKKHPSVVKAGRELDLTDLKQDKVVMFQKNLDPWFAFLMCFILPGLLSMSWNDTFLNGFFVAGCLRYVLVLHFTWLVNSAAHTHGNKPYDKNIEARENNFVAFFAIGEGYHNWHHTFPWDYSTSEHGFTGALNFTTLFIDCFAAMGLIKNRKRATSVWEKIKQKNSNLVNPVNSVENHNPIENNETNNLISSSNKNKED